MHELARSAAQNRSAVATVKGRAGLRIPEVTETSNASTLASFPNHGIVDIMNKSRTHHVLALNASCKLLPRCSRGFGLLLMNQRLAEVRARAAVRTDQKHQ